MGETQKQPFQPPFTVSSQVDIPERRLVLVRIPDERLGIPCIRGSSLRPGPRFCRGVMPVTSFLPQPRYKPTGLPVIAGSEKRGRARATGVARRFLVGREVQVETPAGIHAGSSHSLMAPMEGV